MKTIKIGTVILSDDMKILGSLEIIMDPTMGTVGMQTKVDISLVTIVDVVLVEHIIQTLVEVLEVEQNYCPSSLHANLYLVDVFVNL